MGVHPSLSRYKGRLSPVLERHSARELPRIERSAPQNHRSVSWASTTTGLVLLNSSLKPMFANDEAINILLYSDRKGEKRGLGGRIRALCRVVDNGSRAKVEAEIRSGRRRYVCRGFTVASSREKGPKRLTAILLERSSDSGRLVEMAREFQLTPRERQTVELLAQGLTSKQIANQMAISVNTVKTFLRLVMVKTGVTTRSGILGKVLHNTGK